jgi:hypothetical protein
MWARILEAAQWLLNTESLDNPKVFRDDSIPEALQGRFIEV